jgi:phage baseplate assembly protein gpV
MSGIADILGRLEREPVINPRYYGVVTAMVSQIQDGGLYEVEYLHMGHGEPSGGLARVMGMGAGDQRGCHFFPEVGDEVVVAFEMGNPDLPIILGGVWNQNSAAPSQANESTDNDFRTIVSRTGHELTFDDSSGGGQIVIKTKNGHQLILDDTGGGKLTIQSAGGMKLEMDDSGKQMTLDAGSAGTLQINALEVKVSATAGISLTTTGGPLPASLVKIENIPFGTHKHLGSPPTGPVSP